MKPSAPLRPDICPKLNITRTIGLLLAPVLFSLAGAGGLADELETVAGERLVGKAVSVNERVVVFSSVTLGKVTLARSNVVAVKLASGGTNCLSQPAKPDRAANSNAVAHADSHTEISTILRVLPAQPGLVGDVSSDLLAQAGPEATAKFNQMLGGLLSGRMSMADLRAEAKSVRDQARALRADLGEEGAGALDGYLAILDKFLAETPPAPSPHSRTNSMR